MKKMLVLLVCLIMLAGCHNEIKQMDEEKYNVYLTNYQSILDSEEKKSSSPNFDIQLVRNDLVDKYRYDLIIDNPKIALYNVKVLMIVDNTTRTIETDRMMPSLGMLENREYNLIPYQVDLSKNCYAGLNLSVLDYEPNIHVSVMVSYTNRDKNKNYREFFRLTWTDEASSSN
ncbi:MAG: hypothetical protein IKD99_04755 [Erysipelotrichaceae bacterium]|nr:hypothetical protein [Erysipelotrichaceae bacterium]